MLICNEVLHVFALIPLYMCFFLTKLITQGTFAIRQAMCVNI